MGALQKLVSGTYQGVNSYRATLANVEFILPQCEHPHGAPDRPLRPTRAFLRWRPWWLPGAFKLNVGKRAIISRGACCLYARLAGWLACRRVAPSARTHSAFTGTYSSAAIRTSRAVSPLSNAVIGGRRQSREGRARVFDRAHRTPGKGAGRIGRNV